MARFRLTDLKSVEKSPQAPGTLRARIGALLYSSVNCTARVESLDMETGEYTIVLQGTLDTEETRFDGA